MILLTVHESLQGGVRRPNLPDGASYVLIADHGETMTVEATSADPDALERWAVENGYHTPAQVRTGHLLIELMENWPDVYSSLQAALAANPAAQIAIQHEAHVSRDGNLTTQIQQGLGMDDATTDEIFRAAYLRKL